MMWLRAAWSAPAASAPRGAMGMRSRAGTQAPVAANTVKSAVRPPVTHVSPSGSAAATAFKSKRSRIVKPRSAAYVLLGRYQVDRLLKLKQNNAIKAAKKAAEAEAKEAVAAAEADANLRLRNSLVLRFSNENSYLNWARNGVLSSAVGVAMYAQEHHRGAQLSGAGLLLLGFGYIGVGTAKYIYYIFRFRHVMELSWASVFGTISHAAWGLAIWLTAIASFLESVPLELDAMLLTEPIASFLPFRIRQGLIETYSLHLDDLEHHNNEQERVMRAIRGDRGTPQLADIEEGEELPPQLEAQLIEQHLHSAPGPAVVGSVPPSS
ncbi:Transmembrane protein 160 [Phytophthora citrophthora]|uniref:Transmembrane protein 160 n=1 Tax=Phytophthora citrophthora TaxID=4793 RepID=A0AAD9LBD4_9STRA|nr:Transmembrane protein 160 [Phytophthora citrophthora]